MTGRNRFLHSEIPQDEFYSDKVNTGKVPKEVEAIPPEFTQGFSRKRRSDLCTDH
jgi:hypothetical protein